MSGAAWTRAADADLVALVIDAERGIDRTLDPSSPISPRSSGPSSPCSTRSTSWRGPSCLHLTADLSTRHAFRAHLHDLGAHRRRRSRPQVLSRRARCRLGPWLYPEDQLTDAPLRQAAAEITREKLFLRLHDELPYSLTVETADWKELADGSVRIEQTIYVMRDSQKKIVLGAKGATIKEISMAARKEIGEMIDAPVHLFLFVKVRERWGEDPERYREMGLDYPKDA